MTFGATSSAPAEPATISGPAPFSAAPPASGDDEAGLLSPGEASARPMPPSVGVGAMSPAPPPAGTTPGGSSTDRDRLLERIAELVRRARAGAPAGPAPPVPRHWADGTEHDDEDEDATEE